VIVTLSLFLILNALAGVIWAFDGKGLPSPFPKRNESFELFGASIEYSSVFTWITVIVAVVVVTALLNKTKIGLAFRAVSSNLESSQLVGVHVGRTLQFGWALAAAVGTLAASLYAPTTLLQPNFMGNLLVFSFAAATLGGLDSLGGRGDRRLLIGLVQTMAGGYVERIGGELATAVALAVIVIVCRSTQRAVRQREGGARLMAYVTLEEGTRSTAPTCGSSWTDRDRLSSSTIPSRTTTGLRPRARSTRAPDLAAERRDPLLRSRSSAQPR
jgi:branched-subunit amino acid ABC-type transport system permease component